MVGTSVGLTGGVEGSASQIWTVREVGWDLLGAQCITLHPGNTFAGSVYDHGQLCYAWVSAPIIPPNLTVYNHQQLTACHMLDWTSELASSGAWQLGNPGSAVG